MILTPIYSTNDADIAIITFYSLLKSVFVEEPYSDFRNLVVCRIVGILELYIS